MAGTGADTAEKKVIGTISWETRAMADRLASAKPETRFISYSVLSGIIGKNVQTDGRHNLEAAKGIVLRERGMLFGTVWNEGVKLLDDSERVATGEGVKNRMRRLARKGIRSVMSVLEFDNLPKEQQVKHHLYVTLFRVTEQSTRPKKILQLEGEVKDVMRALKAKEVLALFEKKE